MATPSNSTANTTTPVFPCPTCGQELSRRGDLKRHIAQLHPTGNEQLWKCPHCPYQHVQKSNVKIHAEKHELKRTGERPHTCPEPGCTAAYQDKGLLTRHRKKKHGYQPNHSSRYLEKKGIPSSAENTATSRLSSDDGRTSARVQMMYESPHSPPESISTIGSMSPAEVHTREGESDGEHTPHPGPEFQVTALTGRYDVACQSDPAPATSTLPRLPPITKLFKKADDCERERHRSYSIPRFPGPLVVGDRRPTSAHGHIDFHAPRPGYFQGISDPSPLPLVTASPVTRERRPSSTPCLPTPPAFRTTFPYPSVSPEDASMVRSTLSHPTRNPVSCARRQRRPAPYSVARGSDSPVLNLSEARWHKWWMAPDATQARETSSQFMARPHAVRSH
ncbi:unnamed protein product [Peniophora sp. CBMAI 1063]|nr:unnamed protein product [Peniophora sp. CBMAI 1063]